MSSSRDEEAADRLPEVDRGAPVYVHCHGGSGRTGTVIGCWLIEQGTGGDDPIATIASLRQSAVKYRRPSPETPEQVQFVRDWPLQGVDLNVP